MKPGIDPKVDYVFKKLFGSEANLPLTIHLLNAALRVPPGKPVTGLDLLNPFNEKERFGDKLSVADVKARDQGGRQFNLEMQLLVPYFFPSRALYYWARLHQQQLLEGDYFQTLRPTIGICFLNEVLFPQVTAHHLHFQLRDVAQQVTLTRDLEIHMLQLPRFNLTAEELRTPLDAWCFFLRHAATLDTDSLPAALTVPPLRQAMEVLRVLSQDDLERERYEASLKLQRDQASWAEEMRRTQEESRRTQEESRRTQEESRRTQEESCRTQEESRQARERGDLTGRIRVYRKLLKQPPLSDEELALPLDQLRRLAEQLESQVLPPTS